MEGDMDEVIGVVSGDAWHEVELFLNPDGVVGIANLQGGRGRCGVPIERDQSEVQIHTILTAPKAIRLALEITEQIICGVMGHAARGNVIEGFRAAWIMET